ncbi:MAG: hypothetical protein ABI855_08315 [Bacteroidota bacterium]
MDESIPSGKKKSLLWFDKIVFAGSIIGLVVLLILTFYKNHINKEIILENAQLKEAAAKKDVVIHEQQLVIDSLKRK